MKNRIKLRKGLDIRLKGVAVPTLASMNFHKDYAVKPTDFDNLKPKLLLKKGDKVEAGTPLFFDKSDERIVVVSPVSGEISDVVYGEKRRLLSVNISADEQISYKTFPVLKIEEFTKEKVKEAMLAAGVWSYLRQRPFQTIVNPDACIRDIFVSCFDTAPLACDYEFTLKGEMTYFNAGIAALKTLTEGEVYLGLNAKAGKSIFADCPYGTPVYFEGPHPVGNVGIQIHHIRPINKGDIVGYMNPADVVILGRLLLEGKYDASKTIALAGSELAENLYVKVISGAKIKDILENRLRENAHPRYISGNVLTGDRVEPEDYMGYYHHEISVITEGDKYRFMGWMMPGFDAFSFSRSFFSWLCPSRKYNIDTNLNGGRRAFVVTGEFEKVLPMDVYPLQLIKACIIKDLDAMENLGIYEVAPEDFALCEFIDTSKTEIQQILREGLELVRKELN